MEFAFLISFILLDISLSSSAIALIQPPIRQQLLVILRPSLRHTGSAHTRQLVTVELATAGIPIVDIASRIQLEALFSPNILLDGGSHVSWGPEEHRGRSGCDDGEEEESGDAHCGKHKVRRISKKKK